MKVLEDLILGGGDQEGRDMLCFVFIRSPILRDPYDLM